MKKSFKKALKYFKYLFLLFIPIYWIGVIIDDWKFIEKYWEINWIQYLGIWTLYFIVFALILSIYYWGIISVIILIYHKIIRQIQRKIADKKEKNNNTS